MTITSSDLNTDFSLTSGGPVDRALERFGLKNHLRKRIVIFISLSWLPLLILSMLQGLAIGSAVKVPFLLDIAQQTRLLLVMPLLFIAEPIIGSTIKETVQQFIKEGLILEDGFPAFKATINQAMRWKESTVAEIILVAIVIAADIAHLEVVKAADVSTWIQIPSTTGTTLSLAGWWFVLVSMSIYRFLVFRWLWRFIIWSVFLWQMSKQPLQLMPTHPDKTGGLAFLGDAQLRFSALLFAASAIVAAALANLIVYDDQSPFDFKFTVSCYIVVGVFLVLLPLFAYVPKLIALKKKGRLEYGVLGMIYTQSFDQKWIRKPLPVEEPLLGSADVQSLADLSNSFQVVKTMNIVPFDFDTVRFLVVVAVLPFIPLVLSVIPLQEILEKTREFLL